MSIEEYIYTGAFFLYLGLSSFLVRRKAFASDIMSMKLRFFPYLFKWIGIILCVLILAFGIVYWNKYEYSKELTFYFLNIGLFFIVFSKERIEDEFIHQIRLKALIVSFIGTIAVFGGLFPMYLFLIFDIQPWIARVSGLIIITYILTVYLFYFYYAKLASNNSND
ncbi:hypothetical protein [uncultured Draconibacterium sp.]|uniref:hypothetical protein n=1 Tax=uncultured Draconibacterium sp. TaxID=1573823 RepID=UPI002AA7D604|nr:hypothetical protein [uncultured Draconibacterium sp.]